MANRRHLLVRAFALSVLAHLAVVVLLPGLEEQRAAAREQRVQLTFRSPDESSGFLVEPPDDAEVDEAPPDATHPAEFNAQAQNPEPASEVDGRPQAEGDLELFDFRKSDLLNTDAQERARMAEVSREPVVPPSPEALESVDRADGAELRGSGDAPIHQPQREAPGRTRSGDAAPPSTPENEADRGRPQPRHDSPRSGVSTQGELSLSTYAWAWAPYLRHLKERVSERWQPPLAFYMGLVEGDGVIRFRVHRDGTVSNLEVAREEGHASLSRAARNAVDYGAPFNPLPADFPDPYLDVAWHYRYIVYGP